MSEDEFKLLVEKHRGRIDSNGRPFFRDARDEEQFRKALTDALRAEKPYLNQSWDEIG